MLMLLVFHHFSCYRSNRPAHKGYRYVQCELAWTQGILFTKYYRYDVILKMRNYPGMREKGGFEHNFEILIERFKTNQNRKQTSSFRLSN